MRTPTPAGHPPDGPVKESPEEPEITQEEAVPSDGTDKIGEKMMKDLGRDPGGQQPEDKIAEGKPGRPGEPDGKPAGA